MSVRSKRTTRGTLALTVVGTSLALTFAAGRVDANPASRSDGRITVIAGESGESGSSPRLLVMDADGKNRRSRLGDVVYASLSPNGRSIAYDPLGGRDARVIAADGPLGDRLLVRNGRHVDWSPNGEAIAFVRSRDSCGGGAIWVKNLHSRTQRLVVRNAEWPDWSPDGKKLAFVRETTCPTSSSELDTWIVDLASKRARRLIRGADEPRWSPDGRRIAFTRWNDAESFVYVAHADGARKRRIAEADAAAWSPDGSELAIATFSRITRIRLDGTHRRVVYAPRGGCPACRFLDWER